MGTMSDHSTPCCAYVAWGNKTENDICAVSQLVRCLINESIFIEMKKNSVWETTSYHKLWI